MKVRITALVVALSVIGGLYWYTVHSGQVDPLSKAGKGLWGLVELPTTRAMEFVDLTDQHGDQFDFDSLKDKWTFAFFGYTNCPDICPITMSVISQVETELKQSTDPLISDKFQGMFVTVDPIRDDVATLKEFLANFSPNFIGVTGSDEAIASIG